jgi:hypothetical protein
MAANGDMLGQDQPVILHLLDIEPAKQALEGVKMELMDAAYPLLVGEQLERVTSGTVLLSDQQQRQTLLLLLLLLLLLPHLLIMWHPSSSRCNLLPTSYGLLCILLARPKAPSQTQHTHAFACSLVWQMSNTPA